MKQGASPSRQGVPRRVARSRDRTRDGRLQAGSRAPCGRLTSSSCLMSLPLWRRTLQPRTRAPLESPVIAAHRVPVTGTQDLNEEPCSEAALGPYWGAESVAGGGERSRPLVLRSRAESANESASESRRSSVLGIRAGPRHQEPMLGIRAGPRHQESVLGIRAGPRHQESGGGRVQEPSRPPVLQGLSRSPCWGAESVAVLGSRDGDRRSGVELESS